MIAEYFTSHYYSPVRSLINISEGEKQGPIFNIVSGNLLGILP